MTTLRILHILTRFQRGGAERNVIHTIDWERRAGHEVHLVVGAGSDLEWLPPDPHVHVVPRLVRAIRPALDLRAVQDLRRLVVSGRYDLVHTHMSKAGIVGRIAGRGGRRLVVHTVHMSSFGPAYSAPASGIYRSAEQIAARATDRIVTVGIELMEQYLAARIGVRDQYVVIRSPIDIDPYLAVRNVSSSEVDDIRESMRIPSGAPLVACIGTLEPRKRLDLIVRSLAPDLRARRLALAIAGDGRERPALQRHAASLGVSGSIHWLGYLADPSRLLAAADVLVHAGRAEGVAQVVVQALAAGRPVVATEAAGLREVEQARVNIVPQSGDGLRTAVANALAAPPTPPPPIAFVPWSVAAVDERIAALHADLERNR